MDIKQFEYIVKRKPHIDLFRIIRPQDIVRSMLDAHPHYSDEERSRAREQLNAAIVLATAAHDGVLRKSGEPYITHPYAVAYLLAKMGMSLECVIAGLLHDTVEDTTTTLDEIERLFGSRVAALVDGVTKLTGYSIGREEKQAHAFQKLLTYAAHSGIWVIFVKLADRLHNMMTIDSMSEEQKIRIAEETARLFAPLAHRLGVYWMKEELDALAFYYTHREQWEEIDSYIRAKFHEHPEEVLLRLQGKVKEAIERNCFEIARKVDQITGRIKSYSSIYSKTIKQDKSLASLHDIIGVRVIINTENPGDCYLVMGAIHSFPEFTVVGGRIKDYIARPKVNGYQSLHTVVRLGEYSMEMQIRTREMHRIAEEGEASHWAYKNEIPSGDKARQWLEGVLGVSSETSNPVQFVKDIENEIRVDEIAVFTPKGELKSLPEGATLLDFAYEIHEEVGNACVGGTVNGRKVPIYYHLSNRDEVTIETSKKQYPHPDWLSFVVTHKAKTCIRRFLTKQEKEKTIEAGKETVRQLFEMVGRAKDFARLETLAGFAAIADRYSLPQDQRMSVFFYKTATGEFKLRTIIKYLFSEEEIEILIKELPQKVGTLFPERRKRRDTVEVVRGTAPIYVRGAGEVRDYGVAKCCAPVEGDPVAAYLSPTRGYIVHKVSCPTLKRLSQSRVQQGVFWYHYALYRVELIVEIPNRQGTFSEVVNEISKSGLNIDSAHLDSNDASEKRGFAYLTFKGSDIRQIEQLAQAMKNAKSILSFSIGTITRI